MNETDIILALEQRWVSRVEIAEMLGTNDSSARAYIAELNLRLRSYGKCVLSSATRKGYHIPSPYNDDDITVANIAVNELKSKAVSIFERRQAIEDFLKYAESAKASQNEIQLTLF